MVAGKCLQSLGMDKRITLVSLTVSDGFKHGGALVARKQLADPMGVFHISHVNLQGSHFREAGRTAAAVERPGTCMLKPVLFQVTGRQKAGLALLTWQPFCVSGMALHVFLQILRLTKGHITFVARVLLPCGRIAALNDSHNVDGDIAFVAGIRPFIGVIMLPQMFG